MQGCKATVMNPREDTSWKGRLDCKEEWAELRDMEIDAHGSVVGGWGKRKRQLQKPLTLVGGGGV